jgi:uncharacterized protein YkwD
MSALAAISAPAALAAGTHRVAQRDHAASRCVYAHTPSSRAPRAHIKQAVVCLINRERAAYGLPRLREDSRLDRSAQAWTDTMVATRQFDHGGDFAARISDVGYVWSSAGENIATGFTTPAAVVSAWIHSPGHCQNILDPDYKSVGTGVVTEAIEPFSSAPATWTQDFALPMGASNPSNNWGPADRVC